MKKIPHFESGPGMEALELLVQLKAKLEDVRGEHMQVVNDLKTSSFENEDVMDDARRLLEGGALHDEHGMDRLRKREVQLRNQLKVLEDAIRKQTVLVELERAKAMQKYRREHPASKKIEEAWKKALHVLWSVIELEDRVIEDLAQLGYGRQEPIVTNPFWLNRSAFKDWYQASDEFQEAK